MKKKARASAVSEHTCGECRHGLWCGAYFDYQGKPFLIYCERSSYAYSKRVQENSCLACTPACKFFEAGEKGGLK